MRMQWRSHQFWVEVLLSIGLAIGSSFLATISPFDHLGGISLALIIGMLTKAFVQPTNILIGASMAAIGLQVDFAVLKKHGAKLILAAGLAWLALFTVVLTLCWLW